MSLYNIPHGSTSNSSCSTCSKISYNYAVLQSIPCSPECKIVGQILLDHPLCYAITDTVDVPVVYLQQFWRTVSKVHGPEETIKFMLNTQEFIYIVDMFRNILYLLVETPENPFVAPVNIETIEAFMNRVGYQGVVDKVNKARVTPSDIQYSAAYSDLGVLQIGIRAKVIENQQSCLHQIPQSRTRLFHLRMYHSGVFDSSPHDPDYVPEPMYPKYIPLEDEHVFPDKEQPLPPVVSPITESLGYVVESDPEEYEDD
ncbi:hypothetical protein Tco_0909576 [Tanacetum coccineum]|uniref:Uncharacterized protein n=1 Tax=Tanacetum coccineum TaxID=301880 RepID=A0ABQ5CQC6_9ASTR